MTTYCLEGFDPVIFGDGRPFSADAGATRVRTLDMPAPTTLAGALRTAYGRANDFTFNAEEVERLLRTEVRGPILFRDGQPLFPTPACLVPIQDGDHVRIVSLTPRPFDTGTGSDLTPVLHPLRMPPDVEASFGDGCRYQPTKENRHPFVSLAELTPFLSGRPMPEVPERKGAWTESRIHVGVSPGTQTARSGFLYQTEGVRLGDGFERPKNPLTLDKRPPRRDEIRLAFSETVPAGLKTIGGENRLSHLGSLPEELLPIPEPIRDALASARYVVMILTTPAAFRQGWWPDWIDAETGEGTPPSAKGIRLRLRGIANRRKVALSGWDMHRKGPKPVRWLAPAGSAYFFEVLHGDPAHLADAWMAPVSDDAQDRHDGLGCALWGTWNPL